MATTPNSTQDLARRVTDGDSRAEAELVERYEAGLKLLLLKRTGDSSLAQDLCQDTLVLVISKLRAGELNNPAALSGFVRQVAVNLSIEHFRKEKRYVRQDDGIISLNAPHLDGKADHLDRAQARQLLETALQALGTKRDREILQRFYLLDEDKANICDALALTPAHFDRVLYRAKQRMRQLIQAKPDFRERLFGSLLDA